MCWKWSPFARYGWRNWTNHIFLELSTQNAGFAKTRFVSSHISSLKTSILSWAVWGVFPKRNRINGEKNLLHCKKLWKCNNHSRIVDNNGFMSSNVGLPKRLHQIWLHIFHTQAYTRKFHHFEVGVNVSVLTIGPSRHRILNFKLLDFTIGYAWDKHIWPWMRL